MSMFQKATKKEAKLRMSIAGPSGSGKTFTALLFAGALSPSGKIAVVDTEHGSASKYADMFNFDVMELSNYHPNKYVEAIKAAVQAGYDVVVLDSITHAWNGPGGILSIVNQNFGKWKDVQPIEQAFIEAIVSSPIHIIATMRAKTQYEVEKDDRGKPTPKKVGMGAIQREGMEYEFDIAAMMDVQNTITIEKTRCSALQGVSKNCPDASFMAPVLRWLSATPETKPPEPQKQPPSVQHRGPEKRQPDPVVKLAEQAMAGPGMADSPFDDAPKSPAFKRFQAEGSKTFGKQWDDARHWLIERYTKAMTPDKVRKSSNDMSDDELDVITDGLVEKRTYYQREFGKAAGVATGK